MIRIFPDRIWIFGLSGSGLRKKADLDPDPEKTRIKNTDNKSLPLHFTDVSFWNLIRQVPPLVLWSRPERDFFAGAGEKAPAPA